MDYTQHYNLKKPAYGEAVDVKDLNDNADITDAQLNTLAELVAARLLKTDLTNQIINDTTKAASAATVYSVNKKADDLNSDLGVQLIFNADNTKHPLIVETGAVTLTGSANTARSSKITFRHVFSANPRVFLTSVSGSPQVQQNSVSGITTAGCTISTYRTDTSSADILWVAIGV